MEEEASNKVCVATVSFCRENKIPRKYRSFFHTLRSTGVLEKENYLLIGSLLSFENLISLQVP